MNEKDFIDGSILASCTFFFSRVCRDARQGDQPKEGHERDEGDAPMLGYHAEREELSWAPQQKAFRQQSLLLDVPHVLAPRVGPPFAFYSFQK